MNRQITKQETQVANDTYIKISISFTSTELAKGKYLHNYQVFVGI